MPFMTRIVDDLRRWGLRVEVVPGWETRGSSSFAPAGVVDHWTAGPRGSRTRPSLNICVNGRTGLPGPLCNVYLARDGTCVVVAAGRANHAGTGGWRGLVGNSAVYGIEAESAGDNDWTPEMLEAYPRLNAALLSGLGRGAEWLCGHHEWAPSRKIDIRDIMGSVRTRTTIALAAGPGGTPTGRNDVAFKDWTHEDKMNLADYVVNGVLRTEFPLRGRLEGNKTSLEQEVAWLPSNLGDVAAATVERVASLQGQIAGLTEAVSRLAANPGQAIDLAAIVEAARQGAADGVGESIDAIDVVVRRGNAE